MRNISRSGIDSFRFCHHDVDLEESDMTKGDKTKENESSQSDFLNPRRGRARNHPSTRRVSLRRPHARAPSCPHLDLMSVNTRPVIMTRKEMKEGVGVATKSVFGGGGGDEGPTDDFLLTCDD